MLFLDLFGMYQFICDALSFLNGCSKNVDKIFECNEDAIRLSNVSIEKLAGTYGIVIEKVSLTRRVR